MYDIMKAVTIKVDEKLKDRMDKVRINWSRYIRNAIKRKLLLEQRREMAEKLILNLKAKKLKVPEGFINKAIRETRSSR
jgi:hypothetical protein